MKFLRIVFILLFLIISIGAVSAQDNLTDTLQAEIPATEEVGSFEELENDIINANTTLEITKDYINDDYPEGITISRDNLVINGNNHAIDGNSQNIFFIEGLNITINNLVFKNAYNDFGGAIYNGGELVLNNVTFADNGAVVGGAVFNDGELVLNNVTFADNTASNAGAIYNGGELVLNNVTFAYNSAVVGGAISNDGELVLNNVSFVDNGAVGGGAVYNDGELVLNYVSFVDNCADESGGAICNDGELVLNYVSFVDNCAVESGGAVYNDGGLALNNVSFVDNVANRGGAVYNRGVMELCDAVFIDNSAVYGGAIYNVGGGELSISNGFFSSKISDKVGQIFCHNSKMNICNSTFLNITSSYAPALYIESSDVSIFNSSFLNLAAEVSAGAIAISEGGFYYIEGCEFVNTSSSKNAGALNIDISGGFDCFGGVVILDTLFEDTCSDFGGALIQLGGNLYVNNSNFINNAATYNGGSVYISYVDAEIDSCTFDSNGIKALENITTCGSAIYCDMSNLTLTNSRVINKSKESGSAVYACDSSYAIANSIFMDNSNAIYTDFDKASNLVNNVYGDGSVSTNNTFVLETIRIGEGMQLKLLNNSVNVTNLPSRFDLRDWNWTSPVGDQGLTGACWAFEATEALESALRKACGITTPFSINNLQKTMIRYSNYGVLSIMDAGTVQIASSYLVSWLGAFPQDYDIFDEVGKISRVITTGEDIHIQDVIFVYNDEPGSPQMKSAILKYGSLSVGVYTEMNPTPYFNPETNAQYVNDNITADHAVAIVGWDDNYSKENFPTAPPGDGAWIIKNSWTTDWGDNGYMYLSYYDKSLLTEYLDEGVAVYPAMGVIVENTIPYNKNYQYDVGWDGGFDRCNNASYANVFEALDDDLIAAVGTYFNKSDVDYRVDVYVNGELKLTQEGSSPYAGFHTIKLDEYVPIRAGDIFSAEITSDLMPYIYYNGTRVHYTPGISYHIEDGIRRDLYEYGAIACLKVYTVADDSRIINNNDIQVDYGKKAWFSVRVVTADEHAVVGADVDFTINGKTITVKTNSDGTAKIEISENPGVYVIKTEYNNQTYKNKVTVKSKSPDEKNKSDDKKRSDVKVYGKVAVKPNFYTKTIMPYFQPVNREDVVIVAENSVVSQKEFSEGYSYKITLKSKTGNLLANKKVIIIFNGMIFIGYTDENGTVCFNLTGNMTGLFNITIIFEGDDYYNPIRENRTIRIE